MFKCLKRRDGTCGGEELQEDGQGGPPADALEGVVLLALHGLEAEDAASALSDPVVLGRGLEERLEVEAGQPVEPPGAVGDVAGAEEELHAPDLDGHGALVGVELPDPVGGGVEVDVSVDLVGRLVGQGHLGDAERALRLHGLVGVDDERARVAAEELVRADHDLPLEELHGGRQVGPLLLGARELPVELDLRAFGLTVRARPPVCLHSNSVNTLASCLHSNSVVM